MMSVRKILIIALMVMVFASMQVLNVKADSFVLDELPPYGDKSELTTGGGLTEVNLDIGNMTLLTIAEFVGGSSSTASIYMWKDEYIWEGIDSITIYYDYSAKGEIKAHGVVAISAASLEIRVYDPSGNLIRTIPLFDEDAEINEVIPIDYSDARYDDTLSTPADGMYTIEVCFAAYSIVGGVGNAVVDFLMTEGYGAQVSITIYCTGLARTLSISASGGGTTDPALGTYLYGDGEVVTVTAYPALEWGYFFKYWILDGVTKAGQDVSWYNQITVTMDSNHALHPCFGGGSGGGCPTLFVWDGTDYAEEGILNIHADSDVTVQHEIQNTLALDKGVYNLQLRELDNFTSHIDQVKLYAVDYEGEWHLCPLTYAYHNELGKVKQTLRFNDDNRVDLEPTETIDLKFAQSISYDKTAYFTFEINGYNMKWPGD